MRTSENAPSSTTLLDRYSALENRWICRKWCPILRLFRSKSDKIRALRAGFVYQEPPKEDLSTGAPVGNEVVLGTRVNKGVIQKPSGNVE
jgi:hypothetical protein